MQLTRCFEILQVETDAPWQVIKKSYHSLAKRLHPDLNPLNPDAESKFKEINQAFQVLRNHFGSPVGMSRVKVDTPRTPWDILLQRIRRNPKLRKWKEDCSEYLTELDIRIFHLNIHKKIQVPYSTAQSGASIHMKAGREKFEVKIPSGDWNQMSLCIPGKGEASLFSKKRGDLILDLQISKSEMISPEASSSAYEMVVDKTKIGRVMTLNSSEGPIKFVLPRNTVNGQTFSLRSRLGTEQRHILKVRLT